MNLLWSPRLTYCRRGYLFIAGKGSSGACAFAKKGSFGGLDEKPSIASLDTISGVDVVNKHYL